VCTEDADVHDVRTYTTAISATVRSKEGGRTKIFAPFVKGLPLVDGGHVKQVSDDREALGSRRKRVLATFLASDEVHGNKTESKNDGQKIWGKTRKHFFRGGGIVRESLTKTSSRGARFKSNNMTGSTSIFDEWRDEVTGKDVGGDQGTLGPCMW
jgi:hypothetical protein